MAASAKPKLYYFDGPGRAEVTRLIFVYTGNDFDDVRFKGDEWETKYKAESPLGTAPFYEEGGVKMGGSLAIARYLGEKYGLGGSNAMENAQLESYGDAIADIASKMVGIRFGPEDKRAECKEEFLKTVPGKFGFIEKQIKGDKTFLKGKITWPDLMIYNIVNVLTSADLDSVFKDCPRIKAVAGQFSDNENIKKYYAKQPPPPKQ